MRKHYIGVDVGTGSARTGVFDAQGNMIASAKRDIKIFKPQSDFVEQSSDDIWKAVCHSVKIAVKHSGINAEEIKGIGFDATCSLVVLDHEDKPVTVSPTGRDEQNIIVWMDHRAIKQAERINQGQHPALKYVGNSISPEMETPKLLWLKERLPASWKRAHRFFDLPDFLTYKATGNDTRSLCSAVCKWTYLGHPTMKGNDFCGKWDESYFRSIGLEDLVNEGFKRIGAKIRPQGESIGNGLTSKAARECGLLEGTAVGVSIIDAHAGGISMIGMALDGRKPQLADLEKRLALIGGTSSCHMAVSMEPKFIKGIWGPYFSAMIPGMWLTEGGQTATGALVDFIINNHGATAELQEIAQRQKKTIYEALNERLVELSRNQPFPAFLTKDIHVCPYFHGNRSPRADPSLRGMISGLQLSASLDDLAMLYMAVIQAIAYGAKHIINEMNRNGYQIDTIITCGGGTKNPLFIREHANITGCRIILPRAQESVLLGSAMLGAVASGEYNSLMNAMSNMSAEERTIQPEKGRIAEYHNAKYMVFMRMHDDQMAYRKLVNLD